MMGDFDEKRTLKMCDDDVFGLIFVRMSKCGVIKCQNRQILYMCVMSRCVRECVCV